MKKTKKLTSLLLFLLLVRVDAVFSQASVSTAELRGHITDQAGASIAGATVTVTDAGKGTSRTVTTDEGGNYVILALPPSTYSLKVEATGFAPKTLTDIKLEVGQVASLPIQLAVGSVQAVVNVSAGDTQVVEVERTQQSSVIGERQINNLPINRRNFLDFVLLTPGVTDSDSINDSSDFRVAQTPQSGLSFGGNNGRNNAIMVDGAAVDTNSGASRETVSQEAVQEFQVNRNSYGAEYGGGFGGVVNIVSKTGSNNWHGSAFGYFRNQVFDARNSFDFTPGGDKAPFNRQQYGASLGGPITKDKTFFFTAFEGLNQKQTTFVNLLNDPTVFNVTASQQSLLDYLDRTPLASTSAALRATLTTTESRYPRTVKLFEDASGQFPFDGYSFIGTARADHTFNDKDTGYARFNVTQAHFENQAAGALTAVSRGRTINTFNTGILLSETHFFSPTTINEVKGQVSYLNNDVLPNDQIGPEFNIEGFGNFGRDIFLPSFAIERRFEVSDNLSLVRSTHTFKVGGQFQSIHNATDSQTFFGGRFNFTPQIALSSAIALTPSLGPAVAGQIAAYLTANNPALLPTLSAPVNSLQAFDLSIPTVYQEGFGDSHSDLRSYRYSMYAQDTWKVWPNFTLNLGLRYYIEDNHDPMPTNLDNLQPRVGFSWDPWSDGKTVIRGGFGLFTGQIDNQIVNVVNELNGTGDPTNINIVLTTATSNALGLPRSFDIYRALLQQGIIGTRPIQVTDLAQFGVFPGPGKPLEVRFRVGDNYQNPYSEQASLAIQHDLGGGLGVEVSYLFNRGIHITRNRDVNQFKQTGPVSAFSGTPTFIRFPSAAQIAAGLTSDFRNPLIFQDNRYESTASSFYHAGTLQVTKRFSRHYSINANYTYSKTIDEVTDFNSDWSAQNPLDFRSDRALSSFDQRHRIVISGVFESPLKGESMAGKIFGDWVFSPVFIGGSGRPFNILLGTDANADGRSQSDRPARLGRNTGLGEKSFNVDIRLARRFHLTENGFLEFSFESFNLFNRTNYNGINNIVGTLYGPNYAGPAVAPTNVTGVKGLPPTRPLAFTSSAPSRQLQFGARFNF